MNRKEYLNSAIRCTNYAYKQVQQLLNDWKIENNITKRCVVHHRDDTEETRKYNEEHYERWGFNEDGTFEYGKYILFMTASDHVQYHNKGGKNPMYGQHHTDEAKEKLSHALKGEKHPMYGKHLSEETKAKISESNKGVLKGEKHPMYGKHLSEETKAKMSNALKGENNPFFGKSHTDEAKEKMSQSTKERMQIISDAYKKYKLEGGMLTWQDFIKQYSNGGLR